MIKNIIWWSYERASWQWDVLCILIMCFIFLTPKAWFGRDERPATQTAAVGVKVAVNSFRYTGILVTTLHAGN